MKTKISQLFKTLLLMIAFAMMILCLIVTFSTGHIVAIVGSPLCWFIVEELSKQLKTSRL